MRGPKARHITGPFCEPGELVAFGPGFTRCDSCGLPLLGSMLETLRDKVGLPNALGVHAVGADTPIHGSENTHARGIRFRALLEEEAPKIALALI